MKVNHFFLFIFIASALLVSPNLVIHGIQAKSNKVDDPFSAESTFDVNPSIGISDSKGIEPKSASGTTSIGISDSKRKKRVIGI